MELYGAILKSALVYIPLILYLMMELAKSDCFREPLLMDFLKQMEIVLLKGYCQYPSIFQTMKSQRIW